jgi:hypothetical protein
VNIQIKHARALIGNDIQVTVGCEKDEAIASVDTELDEFTLANDTLADGSQSYERVFSSAGDARPGQEHRLVVSVTTGDGTTHSATSIWVDA